MTLREIILKSKAMINKALKRGYTYDEIAAILSEEGISVKGTTLKHPADSTKSQRRKPEPDHPSDQTATVEPPLKLLTLLPSHQPNHRLLKRIKQDTETDTKVDTKRKSRPGKLTFQRTKNYSCYAKFRDRTTKATHLCLRGQGRCGQVCLRPVVA
jgi:hypothetical protein